MIENRGVLTRETAGYKELLEAMRLAAQRADRLIAEITPPLSGERYLTTEQVMARFHISRRSLQNYRDKGTIPYTSVGGTLLYPESISKRGAGEELLQAIHVIPNRPCSKTWPI